MNATTMEIADRALALPVGDRTALAQALWQSLEEGDHPPSDCECDVREEARRRNAELDADPSLGRSHEEVMASARRAIGCE